VAATPDGTGSCDSEGMGLGGHLLWSSVIRTLHERSGRPVRVAHTPQLSDVLAGRDYRGEISLANDVVFRGNPRIEFPAASAKPLWARWLDRGFGALVRRAGLQPAYERTVFARTARRARSGGQWTVHVDMTLHSYVERETPERFEWKNGGRGHIIDIILRTFEVSAVDHRCELYFSRAEEDEANAVLTRHGIGARFITVEPNSSAAWFGDLRAWPLDRWQAVVDTLLAQGIRVVQLGVEGAPSLRGVIDLSGRTSYRVAALIMKRSYLFLGLEGGLMHTANAVGVPAVVVWGGLTLPEFAGYAEMHTIVHRRVECAPCGLRGDCPYGRKCLTGVTVDDVLGHLRSLAHAS
jgi:hypothetical protein